MGFWLGQVCKVSSFQVSLVPDKIEEATSGPGGRDAMRGTCSHVLSVQTSFLV